MRRTLFSSMQFLITVSLIAFFFSSCATPTAFYQKLQGLTYSGKYGDAADLVEKSKRSSYGSKNILLYYLDRAMYLQLNGNYEESNRMFEAAKKVADEHFTKSVTAEASTLLISDTMRPYYGEDFERVLINVFSGINYALLGQDAEALVEARQADHYLTTLVTNYGTGVSYKEDAFVRYLMGMLYENAGQVNDAYISYHKALEAYRTYRSLYGVPAPEGLVRDALRTARKLGFSDDAREIRSEWGDVRDDTLPASYGELVILDYNGFSAEKVDNFFEIAFGKAWAYAEGMSVQGDEEEKVEQARSVARAIFFDEQIRLAFPKYERIPTDIVSCEVVASSATAPVRGELVEDISAIGQKCLEERIARVRVRTIARAAVKFALTHTVSQKVKDQSGSEALGWLATKALAVASTVTEHADKRSWRSLPDTIMMARLSLDEGVRSVTLKFFDAHGAVVNSKTIENINIKRGRKTFMVVRAAQ